MAITTLSVMPYSRDGAASFKLTESGLVVHFMAYFVAAVLFYWAFIKGPQITPVPSPGATPVPSPGATGQAGQAQITRIDRNSGQLIGKRN